MSNKLFLAFFYTALVSCFFYSLSTAKNKAYQSHVTDETELQSANQLYEYGKLFLKKEEYEKAVEYLQKTIKRDSRNMNVHFLLGCALLKLGKIDRAIEQFRYVHVSCPQSSSVHYNIGYAERVAGRIDNAIAIYKDVIAQHADYDNAYLALGFAYLMKGDFKNGWKTHERYLKKAKKKML